MDWNNGSNTIILLSARFMKNNTYEKNTDAILRIIPDNRSLRPRQG